MEIRILPKVQKQLDKFEIPIRIFLGKKISQIGSHPYGSKKLKGGLKDIFSKRCSFRGIEYRIAYTIENKKIVIILAANTREGFYKQF